MSLLGKCNVRFLKNSQVWINPELNENNYYLIIECNIDQPVACNDVIFAFTCTHTRDSGKQTSKQTNKAYIFFDCGHTNSAQLLP